MMTNELNLKPCPLCGNDVNVYGPDNWRPTFYDPDSGGDPVVLQCDCGLTFSINSYDYQETYDVWNRRTPDLGNEEQTLLDKMFPKCTNCKSRPSDYSSVMCMCNKGIYLPKHPPRKQDTRFRLGKYEEMEINK